MSYVCTVCGRTVSKVRGSEKHPICVDCFSDKVKRLEWFNQLKKRHPNLYELERSVYSELEKDKTNGIL